jgi:hypothetical protein
MPRRDKTPPPLPIRVSHEATRTSKAQFEAAFECLVPVLERRVGPRPEADRCSKAGLALQAQQRMRRR